MDFGTVVYLKTDVDQLPRMFLRFQMVINGNILYCLAQGEKESWHYDFEFTEDRDTISHLL